MARFSYAESENYSGGSSSFFNLKNDGDTAKIRFLINDINDLYGVSTHEIEVEGKKIDVECIRNYDEPLEKCPLCAAGNKMYARLFIPIYNEDAQTSQIWTRGRTYFDVMSGWCARYNPLVSTPMEIERHGKSGDPKTTYGLYPMQSDHSRIEDFPEIKAEGVAFETRTYDELANYVRDGSFGNTTPRNNNGGQSRQSERQIPMRRRPVNEEANF